MFRLLVLGWCWLLIGSGFLDSCVMTPLYQGGDTHLLNKHSISWPSSDHLHDHAPEHCWWSLTPIFGLQHFIQNHGKSTWSCAHFAYYLPSSTSAYKFIWMQKIIEKRVNWTHLEGNPRAPCLGGGRRAHLAGATPSVSRHVTDPRDTPPWVHLRHPKLCWFDPMARRCCNMDYGFPTCDKALLQHVPAWNRPWELIWTVGR
jgi:hypothetical protein